MSQIVFDSGFPEEVKPSVTAILEEFGTYFLKYVDTLHVHFGDSERYTAAMRAMPRYSTASLSLSAEWLTLSPERRAFFIVHELSHVILWPMTDWTYKFIEKTAGDSSIEGLSEEWFTEIQEKVTDQVARSIYHAVRNELPPHMPLPKSAQPVVEESEPADGVLED